MTELTIHLCQAEVRDIPAILEIEQECLQEDSLSREQFVYLVCRSKDTFYVAVEQERTIAYVLLLSRAGTRYLWIYSIAAHPDYRGKKPGQLLMEWAAEIAFGCRAVRTTLEVKESNTPIIKLYMKNGFILVGVKPNHYYDGSGVIYMQRHMQSVAAYLLVKSPFLRRER